MSEKPKLKLALYWAASCGGCEIAVLEINEHILDLDAAAEILFWPVAVDTKYDDVRRMPDGYIDVCLFNGAIRNSEQEEIAHLLRCKSKVLVAFGSCATEGCIPGLANLYTRDAIFERVYLTSQSTDNPEKVLPQVRTAVPEGEITIPEFYNTVLTLDDVVPVEYYVPGCPPQPHQIWKVIQAIVAGNLPEPPAVVGAGEKTCCDECRRIKNVKKVKRFYRPFEIIPDPEICLLEQGLLCMGPATRSGCGEGKALCVDANMPCRGCYGPPPGVIDQGAKMLSAIASVIDSNDPEEIARIIDTIHDPVGTFYRFSLSKSLLRRARV
jgi:F420-non-reducing hydrogenase small subunit